MSPRTQTAVADTQEQASGALASPVRQPRASSVREGGKGQSFRRRFAAFFQAWMTQLAITDLWATDPDDT